MNTTTKKGEEIYELEDPADAAFTHSDNHALGDLKLQPFTIDRQWAAEMMELRWGYVDRAGIEFLRKHGRYPGASRDVALVLWLCSLTDDDEIRQVRRDPISAESKVAEFVAKYKLGARGEEFERAYDLFLTIMNEIERSKSVPVQTNESPPSDPNG
jgi:hypothetical protein